MGTMNLLSAIYGLLSIPWLFGPKIEWPSPDDEYLAALEETWRRRCRKYRLEAKRTDECDYCGGTGYVEGE